MLRVPWQTLRTALAAAIVLSIPAYAVCSLLPRAASRPGSVALAEKDDPIWNGLRIVHQVPASHDERHTPVVSRAETAEVLTEWTFTTKGKPSPYH
jgi:hypothetical protein